MTPAGASATILREDGMANQVTAHGASPDPEMPEGGAGVVYNKREQWWEVWAFGRIVLRMDNRLYFSALIPLRESFDAAGREPDIRLRHLKCATIALDGMNDVGRWRFVEVPPDTHFWRYHLPMNDMKASAYPGDAYPPYGCEKVIYRQASCELRRARVGREFEFAVGRAPEIRTILYHAPKRIGALPNV